MSASFLFFGSRTLEDSDWRDFLLGDCRLARQILPYLVRIYGSRRAGRSLGDNGLRLTGSDDYDMYMWSQACLIVMMTVSVRTGDTRWLEDEGLSVRLVELLTGGVGTSMKERCEGMLAALGGFQWVTERAVNADNRVDICAKAVDLSENQILRDIFYVVTGSRTEGDHVLERDKVSVVEKDLEKDLTLRPEEEVLWIPECPMVSSPSCMGGLCSHLTGLLPIRSQAVVDGLI